MNEVTCPCGATYKGDNPYVFVMEHDGEHAERVIALKPRLRDLLESAKYDEPIKCEDDCETCVAEDPYPSNVCACDECLPLPLADRCPIGCEACVKTIVELNTVPEFCKNCQARYEAEDLAVEEWMKKRSNVTVLPAMGSDGYLTNGFDAWTDTVSRSPEKND